MEIPNTSQDQKSTIPTTTHEIDSLLETDGFPAIRNKIEENSYYSIIQVPESEEDNILYPKIEATNILLKELERFTNEQVKTFPYKQKATNQFYVYKEHNKKLHFVGETTADESQNNDLTRIYISPYTTKSIQAIQNIVQKLRENNLLIGLDVVLNLESFFGESDNLVSNTIIIYKQGKDDQVITKILRTIKEVIDQDTQHSFPKDPKIIQKLYTDSIKNLTLPFFTGIVHFVECVGDTSYDTNIRPWLLQTIGYDIWNPATIKDTKDRLQKYVTNNPKVSFADLVNKSNQPLKNNPNFTRRFLNSPCFTSDI